MFCIWILVFRPSDSDQKLLVSRRHGVLERHFESALRQFLQCTLPKFVRNKCYACEFWSLELQILAQTCWFLEGNQQVMGRTRSSRDQNSHAEHLLWNIGTKLFENDVRVRHAFEKQQVLSRIWSSRENFLSACKTTRKTTWICVLTHKWEVVFS